jgi:hypothetical protein
MSPQFVKWSQVSVTLDTNVYVSALNFGGRAARLLAMAENGAIIIDISDHIENELVRVLREDFKWEAYRITFHGGASEENDSARNSQRSG